MTYATGGFEISMQSHAPLCVYISNSLLSVASLSNA